MTLNINEPTDQRLVSELPYYIRLHAAAINVLETDSGIATTVLSILAGSTSLVVGTNLSVAAFEVVLVSSAGVCNISQIRGGIQGQIKIFIFQDNLVSIVDGIKSDGRIYLNQLPTLSTYNAQQDDVIALVNVGGDGASTYGYWKELWRQLSVK